MKSPSNLHHRHRFPVEIISYAVWLYHVLSLSPGKFELLLAERSVSVSYETIRRMPPVSLTKGKYALLIGFLAAPQRPLTREHFLQATRIHDDIFDRSVHVQILRLRRKLETDPKCAAHHPDPAWCRLRVCPARRIGLTRLPLQA